MTPTDTKWAKPLLYSVSGFLLFELITGLAHEPEAGYEIFEMNLQTWRDNAR